ncbi:MAG: hypothetical protein JWN37_583 [Candidatus Nomurabacteria bacterium]|nr:hypothetical protein [Candidatus Nomurabacteria bacterium]
MLICSWFRRSTLGRSSGPDGALRSNITRFGPRRSLERILAGPFHFSYLLQSFDILLPELTADSSELKYILFFADIFPDPLHHENVYVFPFLLANGRGSELGNEDIASAVEVATIYETGIIEDDLLYCK